MLIRHRSWAIAAFHVVLITVSACTAWCLRFDFQIIPFPDLLLGCLPLLILFRLSLLARFNLLHGYWHHIGVTDVIDIVKAVGLGSLAFFLSVWHVLGLLAFPFTFYVLEAITTTTALAGVRLFALALKHKNAGSPESGRRRVVLVGAGEAASLLIREMQKTEFAPVACVDDDLFKHNAKIHGVPVVGTIDDLGSVASAHRAEEVFIAIPSASAAQMQRISRICERTELRYRTVPGLQDLLMGRVSVSHLQEINFEDLLGRAPVQLDLTVVRNQVTGKVVLVTGAAGSIGSELCHQILQHAPTKLIALDQAETPLFYLQLSLTKQSAGDRVMYAVADIANAARMRQLLLDEGVNIIFHAAAYKHVPLVEVNIRAALNNNVLALRHLLDLAEDCGCEAFLLISSDKAVQPTSFMGATKRLGELMLAARPKKNMRCVSVRFGNVLGSQGSVIPLFKQQIEREGRVTITHPEITRYFMTIPEAVSLVLQAFVIGQHADILGLDMGNPVRILDLAHSLIRLCGKSSKEIKIDITGLRKGEKLYEELFYPGERQFSTANRRVKRTKSEIIPWAALAANLQDLTALAVSGTEVSIRAKVKEMVPEYSYENSDLETAPEFTTEASRSALVVPRALVATAGQGL
jgi:FlaA1/EpsC-like NDP-sugar epimerase